MSETRLARYRFASERVGPQARILDISGGPDDGRALLQDRAPERSVAGLTRPRNGGDCDFTAFADASLDAVLALATIEPLPDPHPFLRQARRVLVDDGVLIIAAPPHDAPGLVYLCAQFLRVDDLWGQTDRVSDDGHPVHDWQRCPTFGDHADVSVDWLMLVARKTPPVTRPWLFLAPGAPQLATMAAARGDWHIRADQVHVRGCTTVWDHEFHVVMGEMCRALGFEYGGNLPLAPDVRLIGDPHDYAPDDHGDPFRGGERIRAAYPVLEGLDGLGVVMSVRPSAPGDYALLASLRPRQVRLVTDGIQNDVVFRDLAAIRGFDDNPLASIPTRHEITCPPWLTTEAETIGPATPLKAQSCEAVYERIRTIPAAQAFASDIARCAVPFTAVVISQHFCRSGYTSTEACWVFYLHQLRLLLRQTSGTILFKAHPRDPRRKIDALRMALRDDIARVRFSVGAECHLPLEAFRGLSERTDTLDVWGTSSSALLGVASWPRTTPRCVDADYLEPEIRREALQFSRRHGLPLTTLRFDDPVLEEPDRRYLRRRFQCPAPERRTEALASRLQEAEQTRVAEAARFENDRRLLEALVRGSARTWIWGSGSRGQQLLRWLRTLDVEPLGLLDSAPAPAVRDVQGVRVWPSDSARDAREPGALVIIASAYADDILRRVESDGDWQSTVLAWTARP